LDQVSIFVPTREDLFFKLNRDAWWIGFRYWLRRNQWIFWISGVLFVGSILWPLIATTETRYTKFLASFTLYALWVPVWYCIYWSFRYFRFNQHARKELKRTGLSYYDYTLQFDDKGIAIIGVDNKSEGTWGHVDYYIIRNNIIHLYSGYRHFGFIHKEYVGDEVFGQLSQIVMGKCKRVSWIS
jgi:hypothetical protein